MPSHSRNEPFSIADGSRSQEGKVLTDRAVHTKQSSVLINLYEK
jgi:hypothetical protein